MLHNTGLNSHVVFIFCAKLKEISYAFWKTRFCTTVKGKVAYRKTGFESCAVKHGINRTDTSK
jgi:hypothetical protein